MFLLNFSKLVIVSFQLITSLLCFNVNKISLCDPSSFKEQSVSPQKNILMYSRYKLLYGFVEKIFVFQKGHGGQANKSFGMHRRRSRRLSDSVNQNFTSVPIVTRRLVALTIHHIAKQRLFLIPRAHPIS